MEEFCFTKKPALKAVAVNRFRLGLRMPVKASATAANVTLRIRKFAGKEILAGVSFCAVL
jgi:hypothetical protein